LFPRELAAQQSLCESKAPHKVERNVAERVALRQSHRGPGSESALLPGPEHVILLSQLK
jgi:hypothetical protein